MVKRYEKSVLEICYLGRFVRDREKEQIKCVAESKLKRGSDKADDGS